MKPRKCEEAMRWEVVGRVHEVIVRLWPTAKVEVYGSFKTALFLPTSDIDLVVFGKWERLPLWTLEKALQANQIADPSSIKVLDKASVPIIKLTDKKTQVKVDISFNVLAGPTAAKFVKENMELFPCLPPLVLVLKQFLVLRDLNEVFRIFKAKLDIFDFILPCVFISQHHPRGDGCSLDHNLGVLLIEFFELYGNNFNYVNTGISVRDGGSYFNKQEVLNDVGEGFNTSLLCIEDPFTPGNYIGKSSYAFMQVKQAFNYAYLVLSKAVNSPNPTIDGVSKHSLLSRIVRVTKEAVEYRNFVESNWGN
ncbi:predicted protein, partial [Nematostella vectensis]